VVTAPTPRRVSPGDAVPDRNAADHSPASCASHELAMIIGDRWSVLVLIELGDHGRTRSADLKRAVDGISQKVLTSCLRRLEQRGLVERTIEPTVPVSVSYELSPTGTSFFDAFAGLRAWADQNSEHTHPT